jgi:hypothetical protein
MEAWPVWMRSLPTALRPLTSRSFNRVPFPYFEPSFHVSEVSYLFLWLIIVYITFVVYLLLSKISHSFVERGLLYFTQCTIPLGLNLEFFLANLRFQIGFIAKRDKKHPDFESLLQPYLLQTYFTGFTSTSMGIKDSFLPHLGHFPSCCWRISSGGLRSAPSYSM